MASLAIQEIKPLSKKISNPFHTISEAPFALVVGTTRGLGNLDLFWNVRNNGRSSIIRLV